MPLWTQVALERYAQSPCSDSYRLETGNRTNILLRTMIKEQVLKTSKWKFVVLRVMSIWNVLRYTPIP